MVPSERQARIEYKRAFRLKKGLRRAPRLDDAHVVARQKWLTHRPKLHDAHVKDWRRDVARMARWRIRHDLGYLLHMRMSVAIRKAMMGNKAGRAWERIVGYTLADLLEHFRRTLPKGYTMGDFHNGKLHIDHIVPKSAFDVTTDGGIRAAWALPNLRPLPASDNHRKGAKRLFLL